MRSRKRSFGTSLLVHGWLAVGLLTAVWSLTALSVHSASKRLKALNDENVRLQSLLHRAERRPRGLRKIAAPPFQRTTRGLLKGRASPRSLYNNTTARQPGDGPLARVEAALPVVPGIQLKLGGRTVDSPNGDSKIA